MAKQIASQTKYVVKLGVLANSFYDPESKANLFRSTPYYFFNHKPTKAILNGVLGGKLIDVKGNIETDTDGVKVGNDQSDTKSKEEIAALKAQVTTLEQENQSLRADIVESEERFEQEIKALTDRAVSAEERLEQALKSEKKTPEKKASDKKTSTEE